MSVVVVIILQRALELDCDWCTCTSDYLWPPVGMSSDIDGFRVERLTTTG